LRQRNVQLAKTSGLDLSFLTSYAGSSGKSSERIRQPVHTNGELLDDRILADAEVMDAIKTQVSAAGKLPVSHEVIPLL
jgi:glutamate synthase (ferredoxin)